MPYVVSGDEGAGVTTPCDCVSEAGAIAAAARFVAAERAEMAMRARARVGDGVNPPVHPVLINRSVGATSSAGTVRGLLASLCAQIACAYGDDASKLPVTREGLVSALSDLLALASPRRPLFIFLDELHNLESDIEIDFAGVEDEGEAQDEQGGAAQGGGARGGVAGGAGGDSDMEETRKRRARPRRRWQSS